MALGANDGVLLVAHGTVSTIEDLPDFLLKIRRGRPAPPELVRELEHRYEAIGGSPLLELTRKQATALARQLDTPVLVGMRLWHPFVEEVLRVAPGLKLRRLVVLPVAPFSVQIYHQAAERSLEAVRGELGDAAPRLVEVEPWGTEPAFVQAWADRIRPSLSDDSELLLTAHSLPTRVIQMGDKYAEQVEECAQAIGTALGRPYRLAYQSQGADGGDWLGPELEETLGDIAQTGSRRVVLAPIGFLAEHVETLYDLDIEAAGWAKQLGLDLVRVRALDDDPGLIRAMANVVRRALA